MTMTDRFITRADATVIQRQLLTRGWDLEPEMVETELFATVLDQMFANLKEELLESPGELLFSRGDGRFLSDYEKAARQVKSYRSRKVTANDD